MAVASGNEFHFHHHQPQVLRDVLAVGGVNPNTATATAFNQDLAVAATDFTVHAPYADYGPHLDVVAPTQVPTTQWDGAKLLNWSGTSAATPHVAGVAALVQSRARTLGLRLTAGEVMQLIRMTADDLYAPGGTSGRAGAGQRLRGGPRVGADPHPARRRAARARRLHAGQAAVRRARERERPLGGALGARARPGHRAVVVAAPRGGPRRAAATPPHRPAHARRGRLDAAPARHGRQGQRRRGPHLLHQPRPRRDAPHAGEPAQQRRGVPRAGRPEPRPAR